MINRPKVVLLKTDPSPNIESVMKYVDTGLQFLGGMETFVSRGSRVLLKPNIGSIARPDEAKNTDPIVIEAMIRLLKDLGVSDLIIGESSIMGTDTSAAFRAMGLDRMARYHNVALRDLKNEPFITRNVPDPLALPSIRVSEILDDVDTLINLPKLKAICAVPVSLGLKNLKGLIHDTEKKRFHHTGLSRALVDLGKVITPTLTIIDGIMACELYEPKEANMLVAGRDVIAVDAVAAAAIGLRPTDIEYLRLAQGAGIGTHDLEDIEILGDSLEKTRIEFQRAPSHIDAFSSRFPEVKIVEKDACSGCVASLYYCLKIAKVKGLLDHIPRVTLMVGAGMKEAPSGRPVVYLGNCAEKFREHHHFLPGCPFTSAEFCALLQKLSL